MEILNQERNENNNASNSNCTELENLQNSSRPQLELVMLLSSKECQLLKTGYKFEKMVYFFCSCDPDQREPMCKDCYDNCHADHVKKETVYDEISAICHCGMNCHKISKDTNQHDNISFQKKCLFMEWSVVSKLNIFYEHNQTGSSFCIFCANFCEEMANLTKKTFKGGDRAFECSCKNETHNEVKPIFKRISDLKRLTDFEFEYLTPTHLINMINLSENSYRNTFKSFNQYLRILKDNLEYDPNYVIDTNIGSSAAMKSLEAFSALADVCRNFFYIERNSELMNEILDRKFIYNLMEKKFDYKAGKTIWLLKNYAMNIYYKLVVRRDFEMIPILSIKDMENMHPLQRLLYVRSVANEDLLCSEYFENLNFHPLERTMNIIEKLNNIKEKHEIVYEILTKCYEICLLYASLHQFNKEQIMRFCSVNDDIISATESDKKIIPLGLLNAQLKMMIPMIKSVLYLVYFHNDENLESYLRGQKDLSKLNFFHSNSEVGKIINKNCINVLNYVRNSRRSIEGANSMLNANHMVTQQFLNHITPSNKNRPPQTSQFKRGGVEINTGALINYNNNMVNPSPTMDRFSFPNPYDMNNFSSTGNGFTSNPMMNMTGGMKAKFAEKTKQMIENSENLVRKVLVYATTITSIAINYPDNYLIGMRKLLDRNRELYLNYTMKDQLSNNLSVNEKNFVDNVKSLKEELEETFEGFFKFELKENTIVENVTNAVKSFFRLIGLSNYSRSQKIDQSNFFSNILENKDIYMIAGNEESNPQTIKKLVPKSKTINFKTMKPENNETPRSDYQKDSQPTPEGNQFKYKTLLNKSVFVFSVVKSVRIILQARKYQNKLVDSFGGNANIEEDSGCLSLDESYLEEVMKLLYFYVENNPDNCMMVLTGEILNTFCMLDKSQLGIFIDFLNYVLFTIGKYNVQMISNNNYMKMLIKLVKRISGDSTRVELLEKTIRAIKLFTEISYINQEHVFSQLREIVRNLFRSNPILQEFKNYLIRDDAFYKIQVKLSSNNLEGVSSLREEFQELLVKEGSKSKEEDEKKAEILLVADKKKLEENKNLTPRTENMMELNGYKIQFLFDIYVKFLRIVNHLFDGNATLNELPFLSEIIASHEIPKILKKKDIDLNMRIEILKFFRMSSIDVIIDKERLVEYHSKFVTPIQLPEEGGLFEEGNHYYFFRDILMVNENSFNLSLESQILKYELKFFESIIISSAKNKSASIVMEYLQDGIVLPLFVFLNKFMAVIYTRKGYDYLKLYEIVVYFLKLKKFLIESKGKFDKQLNFEFKNIFKTYLEKKRNHYSLINSGFTDDDLREVTRDIEEMSKSHFEILNYKNVYAYFEKHLEGFFNKPKKKSLKKIFEKKDLNYDVQKLKKMEMELRNIGLLKTPYEKKIFDGIVQYENDKNKFGESAFVQNLGEQNIQFDSNYRAIILKTVFFLVNDDELSSKYRKENFWHLFKLLQHDTVPSQIEIYSLYKNNRDYIKLHKIVNLFLENLLSLIFASCNPISNFMNEDYYISITIIKILKYMCEEHNNNFQTIFFKELEFDYFYTNNEGRVSRGKVSLFNLLLGIVGKLVVLSKWEKVKFGADEKSISYFYDIFFVIIELLIEMVQGTTPENLESIMHNPYDMEMSPFNSFLHSIKNLLLRDKNDSPVVYKVRNDIINFIVAFLEEKATPKKLISQIASVFNPFTVFETIVNTLKKLYYKKTCPGDINKVKDYKNDIFDHKKCQYFVTTYFSDMEFCQTPEFELSNRLYQYVKLLATQFENEDAINIIDSIKAYEEEQLIDMYIKKMNKRDLSGVAHLENNVANTQSGFKKKGGMEVSSESQLNQAEVVLDDSYVQNYFAVKFFEKITRSVIVQKDDDEIMVLFTLNPLVPYLSQNTKNDFFENVNRETRYTKLFSLMEYSDYFFDEIKYNSDNLSKNAFLRYLSDINYYFFEAMFFILTVVINLILIIKLNTQEVEEGYIHVFPPIRILAIIQSVLNSIVLLIWFIFKFPLYYIIEQKKYSLKKKIPIESITGLEKVMIIFYHTILMRNETNGFLWNIIFSSIGCSQEELSFLFSIQLLIIINLSTTLKNIIRSVTLRYKQLLATAMFVVVMLYVFSSIAFFFLQDDFIFIVGQEGRLLAEGPTNTKLYPSTFNQENQCGSLLYCFFTHLDYGLRTDGGIGEHLKKISFDSNPGYYVGRFFYEVMFFIVIVVILLSIVFGIIIDTFAELREESHKIENDKVNYCYICGAKREELEKNCINYEKHVSTDHDLWTYVDYIIGLKFVDPQETNAINSHVISMIEQKSISWFPSAHGEEENHEG